MIDRCDCCGKETPIEELDGKPSSIRFKIARAFFGQRTALRWAGDRNEDFDRLECRECYGPGYIKSDWRPGYRKAPEQSGHHR